MAQLQKGTTYITGDQVTAANLNALVDSGILTPGAVTDQTAKTVPLAADTILLHSAADTALRKTTMTQLFATPQPLGATTPSSVAATTGTFSSTLAVTGVATLGNGAILGTPASGTVTNLTGTASININGTVGATTPSTIAATTISATGTVSASVGDKITLSGVAATDQYFLAQNYINADGTESVNNAARASWRFRMRNATSNEASIDFRAVSAAASAFTAVGTFTSTGLNSTAIGATTPSTIAATTISASATSNTPITMVTTNAISQLSLDTTAGGATDATQIAFRRNGTSKWTVGNNVVNTGDAFTIASGGVSYASVTSTGLNSTAIGATTPSTVAATTLTTTGNVGIGGTPSTWNAFEPLLQLKNISIGGTGTTNARFMSNIYYNSGWKYYGNGTGAHYEMDGYHAWSTVASGTAGNAATLVERMRIDTSGNVGIGTTSALGGKLNVSTSDTSWAGWFQQTQGAGSSVLYAEYSAAAPNTSSDYFAYFKDNVTARIQLRANGGIGNYSANDVNLSDERLKKDIIAADSYLDKMCAIEVVKFKYKDQTHNDYNLGVIAQQVETVAPEFVDVDGFDSSSTEEIPLKAIYQTDLSYGILKAVQELAEENKSLRKRLAALESK